MTLQKQAEELINSLDLVSRLGQFGETHVVGNVALKTTIKADIDIQIYCELHYEDAAILIIRELMAMGLTDIKERRLRKSKKYLILGKYNRHDVDWDIDITLTQPNHNYLKDSYRFFLDYSPKVTDERLDLILRFKQNFSEKKISGDNSSYYIYLGVLDEDITNDKDMGRYLNKMRGIS